MSRMVRKQIYMKPEHDSKLKQRSAELGISEAELIRRYVATGLNEPLSAEERKAIWERMLARMKERAKMDVPQTGRTWTRDELYEERLERYSR